MKVLEDGGEWVYNPEYSEYFWVGEGEPVVDHQLEFKPLPEKALKKKIKAKEKRRTKYEEMTKL